MVCNHTQRKKNLFNLICELVYAEYPQTNKQIEYLILINLICEFVCGFCGHTQKNKKNKHTDRSIELLRI